MKTTKLFTAAILAAALTVSACAKQEFLVNGSSGRTAVDNVHHFVISGLGQSQSINAARVCNGINNVAKVEVQQTFMNGLLSVVTIGLYYPRQYRVYCRS